MLTHLFYMIRTSALEARNDAYTTSLRGFPIGVAGNLTFAFGYERNEKPLNYQELFEVSI